MIDAALVYVDFERGHWLHMFPRADEARHAECIAEAERDFVNPHRRGADRRAGHCEENRDTPVVFNLVVILRGAKQGFFDIAVNLETCSARRVGAVEPGRAEDVLEVHADAAPPSEVVGSGGLRAPRLRS